MKKVQKHRKERMKDEGPKKTYKKAEIEDPPWLDMRLTKEAMDHLWDSINNSPKKNASSYLAAQNSGARYIQDKDNNFYKNTLLHWSEHLFFKNWNNYYDVLIVKSVPSPVFELKQIWVNYQKQHEFNPPHHHTGLFSFVVFMKIPTHWKEQHELPISTRSNGPCSSDFQFIVGQDNEPEVKLYNFPLCPDDEGRMLFFPAWLMHQVFPFYGTEEERITISGNIFLKN